MGLFGVKRAYAVVDVETTGLYPTRDRVIEVAAVALRPDGSVEHEWSTLLNPMRDLGATEIHRITARDVLEAPQFVDIAGDLAEILQGRVLVGHNVAFDARFIESEYHRAGHREASLSADAWLDTMQLARQVLPSGKRTLAACCAQVGIVNQTAHSALGDARATVKLLHQLAPSCGGLPTIGSRFNVVTLPRLPRRGTKCLPRRPSGLREESFLSRLSAQLPAASGPVSHDKYFAILDRALIDRVLSARESNELVAVAAELGIDRPTAERLNAEYLSALARVAIRDGHVSQDELSDLVHVATLLGLGAGAVRPALDQAKRTMHQPGDDHRQHAAFHLAPNDSVVFTGDSSNRPIWERKAVKAGLVPKSSVSRKTTVLVAEDPDSLSSKARAAADYGIPIITQSAFLRLLEDVRPRLVTPTDGMPKNSATALLPRGSKLQVGGEEKYLDRLVRWLDGRDAWDVIVTLHNDWPARASGAPRMGVRLFGEPVGRLSPSTTAQLQPVIEACETRGLLPACCAQVKGNQLKVDVVIDVARGSGIPQSWLDANTGIGALK